MDSLSNPEILNGLTSVVGAVVGLMKRSQQNAHELHTLAYKKSMSDLKDIQLARENQSIFMSIGRLMFLSVVCLIILGFLLSGVFNWNISVETTHPTGFLSSLWYGPVKYGWHTFKGFSVPAWVAQLCFFFASFYLGNKR